MNGVYYKPSPISHHHLQRPLTDYQTLLNWFWRCHDPTTVNRQGADVGTQYRSVIFYFTELQKKIAKESKIKYQKKFSDPIVTEITSATPFFMAEEYHQKYMQKKP